MRPHRVWIAFVAALLANAARAEPLTLRYGESASPLQSIFALPVLVAERQGFFVREGLNFSIVPVTGGGEATIQALRDGFADVSHVATNFLVTASLGGSDAVAIAAEFNNPVYSLVAKPWIADMAGLKGKTLGLADEKGAVTYATRKLLARHGVGDGDYRFKVIEGTPARYHCLVDGDCAAVPLGQPQDFFAVRQGMKILGLSTDAVPEFLYTVTVARRGWASQHAEAVTRYVRALGAAFAFIRDPARRDDVAGAIRDAWGASDDVARQTLALYFEPERRVLPERGEISLPGLARVEDFMMETGVISAPVPTDRLVDLRYLRAAGLQE